MAVSEEIDNISFYTERRLVFHGYVGPFVILYLSTLYVWTTMYDIEEHFEIGCIALAAIGILQILTCLSCHWSMHIRCLLTCSKEVSPLQAKLVKVVPTPNNGSTDLVRLNFEKGEDGKLTVSFEFQKIKYVYDPEEKKNFQPVSFPLDHSIGHYQNCKGYQDESEIRIVNKIYGANRIDMTVPDFWELFKERAIAPFFVFQVFCVGLWCLDEYWYYSLFTLLMLVVFEGTLVHQQQRNMREIRNMSSKPFSIQVYRYRKWRHISSDELLPGDICSIVRSKIDMMVPCDILLLRGSLIVDESMLTGESVPQMKEPIEKLKPEENFELNAYGKLHCLFSGTKVVNHTPPPKGAMGLKSPDNGCVGYVLRTGFSTSQGKLLKTILYGVKRVTANNLEAFLFILFLLVFAILAASYVWVEGTKDPSRNKYKLFLECTLILTSVVPPELPIELSLAVNSSLFALSKLGVYCTEPFRIPFAGKVDVCCFDKTGTLTSDDLVLEGVAGLDGTSEIETVDSVPQDTKRILASCHALTYVDETLVGDPMEKAFLEAVEWNFTRGDTCIPRKGQKQTIKILHRYHFNSMLKRMSVITSLQASDSSNLVFYVMTKGAPEVVKEKLADIPPQYDEIHKKLSREGGRVLALGYRNLEDFSLKDIRDYSREEAEQGLTFAGFVVLSCPLKQDSNKVIREIKESKHHVVMITGDNALTACHVSRALKLTTRPILVLSRNEMNHGYTDLTWCWQSIDGETQIPLVPSDTKQFQKAYDLCVTGEGLSMLMSDKKSQLILDRVLINIKVYARVDPKQKEYVINKLKWHGFVVLMCGDGTNDVGALKHSHVGVALLPGSSEKWQDPQKKEKIKKEIAHAEDAKRTKPSSSSRSQSKAAKMRAVTRGETDSPALKPANDPQKKLRELLKELEEVDQASIVKLGDASIASPFTSKFANITCILHVIRQGRCTLVTTLQMFKILALNALILAYSQSVLYLKGIKFSDGQATLQGILLAGCFLFISRSKPLNVLAKRRPLPNIFNFYTVLTVILQFAVHFCAMLYIVQEAFALTPPKEEFVDLEKKFEPNLLNSAVYIIAMILQMATFAVNYRGRPFMESLHENVPLMLSLVASLVALISLTLNLVPEFSQQFEIVEFPSEFRTMMLKVLTADLVLAFFVDRTLRLLFGNSKLRT